MRGQVQKAGVLFGALALLLLAGAGDADAVTKQYYDGTGWDDSGHFLGSSATGTVISSYTWYDCYSSSTCRYFGCTTGSAPDAAHGTRQADYIEPPSGGAANPIIKTCVNLNGYTVYIQYSDGQNWGNESLCAVTTHYLEADGHALDGSEDICIGGWCLNQNQQIQLDADGDGTPDLEDTDDDNDGVEDQYDEYPLNEFEAGDIDQDGIPGFYDANPGSPDPFYIAEEGYVYDENGNIAVRALYGDGTIVTVGNYEQLVANIQNGTVNGAWSVNTYPEGDTGGYTLYNQLVNDEGLSSASWSSTGGGFGSGGGGNIYQITYYDYENGEYQTDTSGVDAGQQNPVYAANSADETLANTTDTEILTRIDNKAGVINKNIIQLGSDTRTGFQAVVDAINDKDMTNNIEVNTEPIHDDTTSQQGIDDANSVDSRLDEYKGSLTEDEVPDAEAIEGQSWWTSFVTNSPFHQAINNTSLSLQNPACSIHVPIGNLSFDLDMCEQESALDALGVIFLSLVTLGSLVMVLRG